MEGGAVQWIKTEKADTPSGCRTMCGKRWTHSISWIMQHTSMSTTAQEYSEVVKVDINGIPADLYIGNETSPEKALIWVDEANQVVFNIQGNISNEDIVHIAQSLILSIPTK